MNDYRINSLVAPVMHAVIASDVLTTTCCTMPDKEFLVVEFLYSQLLAKIGSGSESLQTIKTTMDEVTQQLGEAKS